VEVLTHIVVPHGYVIVATAAPSGDGALSTVGVLAAATAG